ncbi:acyl-CoA thioesterase [Maribacter polysiphoniae]|uniref:Acyl-CoA thioester hydrolase n=1 Tax=Maribacter polysiphoniae TaxID=429344 RepID=A0A316E1I4_9FLAO|nr:thioesterase family protein [Maribacter polysiphoniae]MBD1261220.1 acyl-CoA thioesterase [Maribacter polysiphoniae]PWK23538.1 acyl-CoA thioester hydrolase [Maribacter polysiphoniae]
MDFHEISFRVRYAETDQMGVVHHGNYPQYLEMGRTEWLRSYGISYKAMEDNGIILPVVSISLNFKKSAYYDDIIVLRTYLRKKPMVRIEFDYEIYNGEGDLLAEADTVLAFMDAKKNKPIRCPADILEKIGF